MKRKTLIFIFVGVLLLLLIIKLVSGSGSDDSSTRVAVEAATIADLTEIVDASGKIQPEVEVKISAEVSGEIIELNVREGDKVSKGDLLCVINPDLTEAAVNRAEAALNSSRANLANSKARLSQVKAQFIATEASFKRSEKLHKQGAISTQEYESALSGYEMGKADVAAAEESVNAALYNVKSAEASVKEARDNLGRTTIFAPMDGTVSALFKEQGERVSGTGMMEGTIIMHVANLAEMEADVEVNESLIPRVKEGDTAYVEVDAYLGRKFKGIVTEISQSPNTTGVNVDQVTNYPVKIHLLASDYADLMSPDKPHQSPLRPGMSATVEIHTETAKGALVVPIEAVTTRKDTTEASHRERFGLSDPEDEKPGAEKKEDLTCVFVVKEGVVNLVVVETGIQDSRYMQIKSGLEEGQEVVVSPYEAISKRLFDGDKVKVTDKDDLFVTE